MHYPCRLSLQEATTISAAVGNQKRHRIRRIRVLHGRAPACMPEKDHSLGGDAEEGEEGTGALRLGKRHVQE